MDHILSWVALKPLRCRECRFRFFRFAKFGNTAANPGPTRVKPLPPRTILILEADDSIRQLWRRILERAAYAVIDISDAGELIPTLRAHQVDLLLAELPQMSAFALSESHPYLKTIGISDDPNSQEPWEGSRVLIKPFAPEALLDSIRSALSDLTDS